jgi:hypothetical protein
LTMPGMALVWGKAATDFCSGRRAGNHHPRSVRYVCLRVSRSLICSGAC